MPIVYAMSDLLSYLEVEGHDLLLRDYGRRVFHIGTTTDGRIAWRNASA